MSEHLFQVCSKHVPDTIQSQQVAQQTINCSKSTIERLENCVKYV